MNKKRIAQLFDAYLEKFQMMNSSPASEYYKWGAVARFQEAFDLEAPDFAEMFKKAQQATKNLIDSRTQPSYGIYALATHEPETVRELFRCLLADDGGDLDAQQEKIEAFIKAINELVDKYYPDSYRYENDQRSAMAYLFLCDPNRHYLYKATEAQYVADRVGFYDEWGTMKNFDLPTYYRFCDELLEEVKSCEALVNTHKSRFEGLPQPIFADEELHVLLFDIIYCAHTYNLFAGKSCEIVTSKERKLYEENKKKALALAEKVAAYEEEAALLDEANQYFADILSSGATIRHSAWGEAEFDSVDQIPYGGEVYTYHCFRLKASGEKKRIILFTAITNGQLIVDAPDFTEKVAAYKNVMARANKIGKWLNDAIAELKPYRKYLD